MQIFVYTNCKFGLFFIGKNPLFFFFSHIFRLWDLHGTTGPTLRTHMCLHWTPIPPPMSATVPPLNTPWNFTVHGPQKNYSYLASKGKYKMTIKGTSDVVHVMGDLGNLCNNPLRLQLMLYLTQNPTKLGYVLYCRNLCSQQKTPNI